MFGQGLWCLVKGSGVWSRVGVFGQGLWCLVKGCGVWLTFVVCCQGLRCLVKDFLNDFNIILQ